MGQEIERKFLLKHLPKFVVLMDVRHIEQNYLVTGDEELRIRKEEKMFNQSKIKETRMTLTIKKGSGLVREETETVISEETYNHLSATMTSAPIRKTRGYTRLKGLKIEVDTYENPELESLQVAEIEFDTAQEAVDATLPHWIGEDVTEDANYKNQKLWEKVQIKPEPEVSVEDNLDFGAQIRGLATDPDAFDLDDDDDDDDQPYYSTEEDSFSVEGKDVYDNKYLIGVFINKEDAILRAHNLLTVYDKVILRGWNNGIEVSCNTITNTLP